MGTALTQQQLRELRQLARNVVLLFDADAAGSDAALRGLELASSPDIGLNVRVALPPRGSDPAEVAASGREAVDRMLAGARSVLAFRVSLVLDAADTGSVDGRTQAYEALRTVLRDAPATPERDELVRLATSRLRLASDAAAALAARPAARRAAAARTAPRACAWTRLSATSGCCSRSPWRAAIAAFPCSSACRPRRSPTRISARPTPGCTRD